MSRSRIVRRVLAGLLALAPRGAAAQHTLSVSVPVGVGFTVNDVSAATAGSPTGTQVRYFSPSGFLRSDKVRVSVQADTATFAGPGTTHIPASKVSWTATTSTGTASNGTLSAASYTQVYLSPANLKPTDTGAITINWTLAAIAAAGLRSGTHTLTVRWKFEAF